jgi:hypothetical protein
MRWGFRNEKTAIYSKNYWLYSLFRDDFTGPASPM